MAHPDSDDHLRRRLRTLQRIVGGPTDATLARRSRVAAATFSEAMAGKRRPRDEFVAKVIAGCVACARAAGRGALDEQHILQALRLPGHTAADDGIFERDGELNSCSSVLDGVRGRAGATIVVEGPAGIGKSELLARVCAEGAVSGITPLAGRLARTIAVPGPGVPIDQAVHLAGLTAEEGGASTTGSAGPRSWPTGPVSTSGTRWQIAPAPERRGSSSPPAL